MGGKSRQSSVISRTIAVSFQHSAISKNRKPKPDSQELTAITSSTSIAIVGFLGFAAAAIGVYLELRRRVGWANYLMWAGAMVALGINIGFVAGEIDELGLLKALRQNFDSTLLLATLIGLVGLGTHPARSLHGLDGFLFIAAALAQLSSLLVADSPAFASTERPWFISHPAAFALSGALFAAAGVAGVAYLIVHRMLRRKRPTSLVGRLASLEALERFGRWTPILGFPVLSYGILTGICGVAHRGDIGRTAWYLDPSFVSAGAAWLVYAVLCFGLVYVPRIRGRLAAALSACGLALIAITFVFTEAISNVHQ